MRKGDPSREVVRALLAWYRAHQRDLPWRKTRDPYAIWVSEVMLQQTRVSTVVPYYLAFIERFPNPAAAVLAGESAILAAWTGLGYYRRARFLFRGLERVVAHHGGEIPMLRSSRRVLPGVGDYTSGAIGSIAFDLPEPAVDGNVVRVLSRLFCVADTETKQGKARIVSLATALVWLSHAPRDWNQALMELGARICLPTRSHAKDAEGPKCTTCPVQNVCGAYQTHTVAAYPQKKVRSERPEVPIVALILRRDDGRVLAVKNTTDLFGGLYGPLWVKRGSAEALVTAQELVSRCMGVSTQRVPTPKCIGTVSHTLTHRELVADVFVSDVSNVALAIPESAWIVPAQLGASFASATFFRKMMLLLESDSDVAPATS